MLASESAALDGVAARLVAAGAELDAEDENNGATALVKACAKGREATALLLCEAGASLGAADVDYDMGALEFAEARGMARVVAAIRARGGRTLAERRAAAAAAAAAAVAPDPCAVCFDAARNCALVPCGHAIYCVRCAVEVRARQGRCSLCRAPIERVLRLFA